VRASIWRPAKAPRAGSRLQSEADLRQLEAHVRSAAAALKHRRLTLSSVLDREAAPVLRELCEATRRLDAGRATALLDRLVGWGEGLTPAGDDFIVGWHALLGALADGHADRLRFLRRYLGNHAANVTDDPHRRALLATRGARPLQRRRDPAAQRIPGCGDSQP
jgi:hypothetical protein